MSGEKDKCCGGGCHNHEHADGQEHKCCHGEGHGQEHKCCKGDGHECKHEGKPDGSML